MRQGFILSCLLFTTITLANELPRASEKIGISLRSFVRPFVTARRADQNVRQSVLVILKNQARLDLTEGFADKIQRGRFVYDSLRKTALATQGPLVTFLRSKKLSFQRFYIMNLIQIENATPALIEELAARDDVAKLIANPSIKMSAPSPEFMIDSLKSDPALNAIGDNLVSVGAARVWQELGVRGKGIVVAGQDTGVDWNHPALKSHYRGNQAGGTVNHNYNWHDSIHKIDTDFHNTVNIPASNPCGYDSALPCDDDQHGTHTMGTMVGSDGGSNQIGMAPDAQWMACRNMDQGVGTPARYIECFEFFLAPYPLGGDAMKDGDPSKSPHVINNSWGCPKSEGCEGGEILPVLQALMQAGVMVVASAGNDGPNCGTIQDPPAHYTDATLSVGAFNHLTGAIASFSSRGPSKFDGGLGPDVVAPGVNIRSSVPGGSYAQGGWSGTSMSGPHVVGEVALLWSAKPALVGNIKETLEIIRKSSDPKQSTETCGGVAGTQIPNNTFGYGAINAYKAVTTALEL